MAAIARSLKALLTALLLLVIAWAFFDVGRRAIGHWTALAERPVELTVLHWGDPSEDKIVDDLVKKFEAEHSNVRIVRINAGGDFVNKLKTMMAGNSAPDVFYLRPDMLAQLAEDKLIAPLDDYVANEPAEWKNDFWPIVIDALHYDTATGALGHGKLYGLPKDFTTTVFYINIDLFEKAGIDWRTIQKNGWNWDEFSADMQKITALNGTPGYEGRTLYGTLLQIWPDTLRNMLWTYDGDFFKKNADGTPDFAHLAFNEPGAQKALQLIKRLRLDEKTAFNATGIAKDGGQEFKIGNIGCTGPIGHWFVPQLKDITQYKWDVLPVPRGTTQASQIFYTGWTMSSHSQHPKEAYELIRFLCGRDGQVQQARAGLAIPALQSVAYSDDFLRPSTLPPHDGQLFLDAIKFARLPQLPRATEFTNIVNDDTNLAITAGRLSTAEAADLAQKDWSAELNKPLRTQVWPKMPWLKIVGTIGVIVLAAATFLFIKARREKLGALDAAIERSGFAFISPWIIGFTVLTLGPMLVSLLLAFAEWTGMVPLGDAKYVGLANFKQLLTYDPLFLQSLKVTAYFVILGVPLGQITALLIAMLMNSRVRGIAFFRTVYFVPSVISGAALAVLWLQLFNNEYGVINQVLRQVLIPVPRNLTILAILLVLAAMVIAVVGLIRHLSGAPIGRWIVIAPIAGVGLAVVCGVAAILTGHYGVVGPNAPNWFGYDQTADPPILDAARWAVPGFVLMGLWGVGSGMIIYLAGLKGISVSLYEAARIDGAGPIRQAWNVTIPMLSPLIFYNLVMGIIGSFQVFTQAYIMTNGTPENTTLFYVLNLYRQAFEYHNMGYASAMAWVLFLIVLVLTLAVFKGSKKLVYYEGLK